MRRALAVCIAVALAPSATASAAVFSVNATGDRPDANLADAICAAANGKCTLRAAVAEANNEAGDDQIDLPEGVFRLTQSITGTDSESVGDLDITDDLDITGEGIRNTIIEQTVKDHVVSNFAGGVLSPVTLEKLTITGGRETGDAGPNAEGGGIYNEGALLLQQTSLRGNAAMKKDSFGGAVWSSGILLIGESKIRDNRAKSRMNAAGGGGIYAFDGPLSILDSRISGNVVRSGQGPPFEGPGGIRATDNVTLDGVTIAGNRSRGDVGGLSLSGDLDMRDSTISGNSGDDAGGLFTNGAGFIENSTISGNESRFGGAGIFRSFSTSPLTLSHVTLVRNEARQSGAGIVVATDTPDSTVRFEASIFSNIGPECAGELDAITSFGFNVWSEQCGPLNDVVAAPKLERLAANPGPFGAPGPITKTHALKPGSPAIDLVTSGCPPPAFDQRGIDRHAGACDSGAFEVDG